MYCSNDQEGGKPYEVLELSYDAVTGILSIGKGNKNAQERSLMPVMNQIQLLIHIIIRKERIIFVPSFSNV